MGSPFVDPIVPGNAGRISPNGWTPPDGSHALCIGNDLPGQFYRFEPGDEIEWSQSGDFSLTGIMRFRARTRGPVNMPHLINVTTAATQTYTATVDGTVHSYIADTTGLAVAGQTGSVASLDAIDGNGWVTVSGLTGMSEDDSVGRMLSFTGAATGANNGTFPIREWVSATSVKVENASGVAPDGNNGSISWTERRMPDTVNTIAAALSDVIDDDSTVATAQNGADGTLAVWPIDPTDELTVAVAANMAEGALTWTASMEIDGAVYFSQEITKGRTRERYDGGGNVPHLTPGAHTLAFKLQLSSTASGPVELEMPAFYVDQIVMTDGSTSPTVINDLAAWWRDDSGINGDPVDSWDNDDGSLGGSLDGTLTLRPTQTTLGSRVALLFDDLNDSIDWSGAAGDMAFLHDGTGATIVMVFSPTGHGTLIGTGVHNLATNIGLSIVYLLAVEQVRIRLANGSGSYVINSIAGSPNDIPVSTPALLVIRIGTGESPQWEARLNGAVMDSGSFTGSPSASASSGFSIGNRPDHGNPLGGKIPTTLLYDRYLNMSEVLLVEAWANARGYGL